MRCCEIAVARFLSRRRLYLKIDADNFALAILPHHSCALAEFRKANVRTLAEFEARGDKNAVDFEAGASLKFEEDFDQAGVACASAEDPAATSEKCAGDGLYGAARVGTRNGAHL